MSFVESFVRCVKNGFRGARLRVTLGTLTASALVMAGFTTTTGSATADESASNPVGSFNVGAGLAGGIDEATGKFATQLPLASLPGLPSAVNTTKDGTTVTGQGGFDLGLSYRQDTATSGTDRYGFGSAWVWNIPYVNTDGGTQVFPASGGVFHADAQQPSGLAGYMLQDAVFSQTPGVLAPRGGVTDEVPYAYSLETAAVGTDYFNSVGDLVTRAGLHGERVDFIWESDHRLVGVVDAAGSRLSIVWGEAGVEIISPTKNGHDTAAKTVLHIIAGQLQTVINPVAERINFRYTTAGFLEQVSSKQGAVTDITYQSLPDGGVAVDQVRVSDGVTGSELSTRQWKPVGEHTSSGYPLYAGAPVLWGSGDNTYRYKTVLSDKVTDVVSEYNSLGLLVSRDTVTPTLQGDVPVREHHFTYEGTQDGGVPDPGMLPKQYSKPTQTTATVRDSKGGTRTVTEQSVYDKAGHVVKHVGSDGTVTETVYDTKAPEGATLPVGLVVQETTTGTDGAVSKTVNTLTPDRKSVHITETFTGSGNNLVLVSRGEFTVSADGFITQQRVTGTNTSKNAGSLSQTGSGADESSGADAVVTRFERTLTPDSVILTRTDAVGSDAQTTSSTQVDSVSGLPVSETDPTGRVASTSYDLIGRPVIHTDFTGLETTTVYENNVTRTTDPSGITHSEWVDATGRVTKVTDNITTKDGVITPVSGVERTVQTRKYDHNGSAVTTIDSQNRKTVSVSDMFGRPVKITGPNGVTTRTTHDDVGNTTTTTKMVGENVADAAREVTTRKDDTGRVVQVTGTRKDGVVVPGKTSGYDGLGRVVSQTSNDMATSMVLNADGTPRTTTTTPVSEGEGVVTDRQFDGFGVSTQKTLSRGGDARKGVTRVVDSAGRTMSEKDQGGAQTFYTYTPDGLVATSSNTGTGVTTANTYDVKTRALTLTEITDRDGVVSSTAFEYDPITHKPVVVFDPADRAGTQIRYTYDLFGNTTGVTYPDGRTLTHVFDEYNRKLSTTDIDGNVTRYAYDRLGLVSGATQTDVHGNVVAGVAYEYDPYGRVSVLKRDNGLQTRYTFTSADEIASEKTTRDGVLFHEGAYTYDSHGNLTQRVDTRPAGTNTGEMVTETTVYAYNGWDQLTGSAVYVGGTPDGAPREETGYVISVDGSVTKETVTRDGVTVVREFEHNLLGQTTAIVTDGERVSQTFDEAGNLTVGADGTVYVYNVRNQPVMETRGDGTTTVHAYWVTGQRESLTTSSETGTETVGLYWDGDMLVNDTYVGVSGGTATGSYVVGVSRNTRTVTGSDGSVRTGYYITDRHGNTVNMVDDAGEVTAGYKYTDYGVSTEITASGKSGTGTETAGESVGVDNPFQHAGEYTTSAGRQLLGNRVYVPEMLGFTTKDTANLFNLYAYGSANPIKMVDPTGNTAQEDLYSAALGVLSGVSLIAGLILAGTAVFSGPIGWLGWVAFVADLGASGTGGVVFADTFIKDDKKKLLQDSAVSTALTWTSFALGFVGGITAGLAGKVTAQQAAKKAAADKILTNKAADVRGIDLFITGEYKNLDDLKAAAESSNFVTFYRAPQDFTRFSTKVRLKVNRVAKMIYDDRSNRFLEHTNAPLDDLSDSVVTVERNLIRQVLNDKNIDAVITTGSVDFRYIAIRANQIDDFVTIHEAKQYTVFETRVPLDNKF